MLSSSGEEFIYRKHSEEAEVEREREKEENIIKSHILAKVQMLLLTITTNVSSLIVVFS